MLGFVERKSKPKQKYKRKLATPSERRRSDRLKVKRQEIELLLQIEKFSSDGLSSDDSSDLSSPSPKRARSDSASEEEQDAAEFIDANPQPVIDEETIPGLPAMEDGNLNQVKLESTSNQVSEVAASSLLQNSEVQPPVKRKRGRPRKVRIANETIPESGNSAEIPEPMETQDDGLVTMDSKTDDVGTVPGPQLMTLMTDSKTDDVGTVPGPQPLTLMMDSKTDDVGTVPGSQPMMLMTDGKTDDVGTVPAPQPMMLMTDSKTNDVGTVPAPQPLMLMTDSNTDDVGTVPAPQPMTLSLAPPPMPSGKVPQPAGVLLLPLYSSVPTEPGEQSSLMVVQPHQLANFPFTGGQMAGFGEVAASLPPILTPSQPVLGPLVTDAISQAAVYMAPTSDTTHAEPT